MKKLLLATLVWPLLALAQSYPSPTFNNVTMNGTATIPHAAITGGTIDGAAIGATAPSSIAATTISSSGLATLNGLTVTNAPTFSAPLSVASGGTNCASASGACLDNVTGFSSTGFVSRSGAGSYTFTGSTGSGSVVLATAPSLSGLTVASGTFASPAFASFGNQTTWLHSLISCSTDCSQTWSQSTGGGSGLLGATRTSDNTLAGSMAAQGVAGYAINDNTTQVQTAYGGYFEARKSSGAGTTQVIEADLVNQGALVTLDPYNMLTTGITPALWLSSGRPDVTSGATNASAAVGIINNNTQFDKGIVFQSNSVTVNSGEAVAFALPANYALNWYASAGTKVARIRSDATTASLGLVFANGLFAFQNMAGTTQVSIDTSGNLTANGNVSADSTTYLLGNIAGQSLPGNGTTTGANSIGWNRSNGGGETNFVNAKGGGSTGGFQWCQWNGTTCANTATLTSTGSFSTTGGINGTGIGGATPSTGAFTTLSASSTVSGTGFSNYLASPPAIGGTAAAAGSFTALSASTANPNLLYNQGGTGAVNRSYQSKFQESLSVKDFGATGNGSTDDTSSIQAAVNAACSAGGAVVNVPPGTYKIASTVTINCSYVTLRGAGKNVSTFASSSTTADTLVIGSTAPSAIQDVYVYGLAFVPSVTKTAGFEIHVAGNNSTIELADIIINGGFSGIELDSYGSAIIYKVHNVYFQNISGQALIVGTTNGLLQDLYAWDLGFGNCGGAMLFQNVSGFFLWDIDAVSSSGNAIQFAPGNGQKAIFGFFDTVLADTTTGIGWLFQPSGTGAVGNIVCTKCWSAGSTGVAGVYINGANVNGITWDAGIVRNNQQHGIWLNAGTNVVINSSQIFNNSLAGSGSYQGIVVSSGFTGFTITNNISGQGGYDAIAGGTNKQAYGLLITSSSTTNNFIVTGNRFPGNVTAGSNNGSTGANQVFTNNLNF